MESRAVFFFFRGSFFHKTRVLPTTHQGNMTPTSQSDLHMNFFTVFFFGCGWWIMVNYGEIVVNYGILIILIWYMVIFLISFFFISFLFKYHQFYSSSPLLHFGTLVFFFSVRFCQLLRAFPPARLGIKNGDLLTVTVKARGVPEAWLQVSKNGW